MLLFETYAKGNKTSRARELFDHLIKRDVILCSIMIPGYLQNDMIDEVTIMFSALVKAGVRPNSATVLILLSAFADLTDVKNSRWVHDVVVRYSLQTDIYVSMQILQ